MPSVDRLCRIPIYSLLLNPKSYLPENNILVSYLELLNKLPNHDNKNHKQVLQNKEVDYHKIYYSSILLIETKVFCNSILRFSGLYNDSFDSLMINNDLNLLFQVLIENQLIFFKTLIIYDIKKFKLETGRVISQINCASDISKILSVLRGYHLIDRIVNNSIGEIAQLY